MRPAAAFVALVAVACSSPPAPDAVGPYTPGHRTFPIVRGERTLQVEVWYPAADGTAIAQEPMESYATREVDRTRYADLLSKAPAGCPTRTLGAVRDAAPGEGPWPLVVFSHCFGCTRFSSASLAVHLASHGFAVAAPDHAGNTLFDQLDGATLKLDTATLRLRADDQKAVLDALLDGTRTEVPEAIRGRFDATRVGAYGHSFGSVTTGLVTEEDPRVKAAAGVAAPMENVLLPGVTLSKITVPLLFLLAREDNSITELGNENLRDNFVHAPAAAWLVEIADAGHLSFSDVAGLSEELATGCGTATRQTDQSKTFTYLPATEGIAIARGWLAAFFKAELTGDETAKAFLAAAPTDARVTVDSK